EVKASRNRNRHRVVEEDADRVRNLVGGSDIHRAVTIEVGNAESLAWPLRQGQGYVIRMELEGSVAIAKQRRDAIGRRRTCAHRKVLTTISVEISHTDKVRALRGRIIHMALE